MPDESAYTAYVTGRLPALRRTAYLLADDLVQTTITKLYPHWRRASAADNMDGYVRSMLVRTFLSERRHGWVRRTRLVGSPQETPEPLSYLDDSAVETRLVVHKALTRIAPRARAVLVLRFLLDLPVAEALLSPLRETAPETASTVDVARAIRTANRHRLARQAGTATWCGSSRLATVHKGHPGGRRSRCTRPAGRRARGVSRHRTCTGAAPTGHRTRTAPRSHGSGLTGRGRSWWYPRPARGTSCTGWRRAWRPVWTLRCGCRSPCQATPGCSASSHRSARRVTRRPARCWCSAPRPGKGCWSVVAEADAPDRERLVELALAVQLTAELTTPLR